MKERYQLVVGLVVLIVLAGGAYLVARRVPVGSPANLSSSASSTVVPTSTIPATAINTTKRSTTSSPSVASAPSPGIGTAKNPYSSPADAVQASLWLGSSYKQAGNYAAAEHAWLETTLKWPNDATAYNNLGDLYLAYLKDYPKAEASYRTVIRLDPHEVNAYRALLGLYTATPYHPSPTAAEDILKQGIAANPKTVDLYILLARYYRDSGRMPEAHAEYDMAIANARAQGQVDLAAQVQAEEAAP